MNALSKKLNTIPLWLVQTIVGVMLSAGIAWTTWASVTTWKHETRISVTETKVDKVRDDIVEIKDSQKEINHKLDRLIERQIQSTHRIYGR